MIKYYFLHEKFSTNIINKLENNEINPIDILMITY